VAAGDGGWGGGARRLGEAMETRLGGAERNGEPRRAFIGTGRRFGGDIFPATRRRSGRVGRGGRSFNGAPTSSGKVTSRRGGVMAVAVLGHFAA
jgi:hypothetical protein